MEEIVKLLNAPCTKESEYRWCKGERTYHTETGPYCIFHLPKGSQEKDPALLKKSVFERIASAKTKGEKCDLSGTVFGDDISFSAYTKNNPLPQINFTHAIFCGEVDFRDVVFEERVTFGWGTFEGDAYFNSAVFKKKAEFYCTVFEGGAYFLYAEFAEEADFTEMALEGDAVFIRKTFLKGADFNATGTKDRITFDQVDLRRISFLDCDLRKVDFINCTFPEVEGNRRALYDELVVRKLVQVEKKEEEDDPTAGDTEAEKERDALERVEILYRKLKQKYLDERDYGQASEWHIREKEMLKRRTGIKDFLSFILLRLYHMSSGYGEDPGRALSFLILMICGTAWLLSICGMQSAGIQPSESQISWPHNMDFYKIGQLFLSVFQYLTFQKDISLKPISIGGEFVRMASQILIPLQAALFGLAVRNRFRR